MKRYSKYHKMRGKSLVKVNTRRKGSPGKELNLQGKPFELPGFEIPANKPQDEKKPDNADNVPAPGDNQVFNDYMVNWNEITESPSETDLDFPAGDNGKSNEPGFLFDWDNFWNTENQSSVIPEFFDQDQNETQPELMETGETNNSIADEKIIVSESSIEISETQLSNIKSVSENQSNDNQGEQIQKQEQGAFEKAVADAEPQVILNKPETVKIRIATPDIGIKEPAAVITGSSIGYVSVKRQRALAAEKSKKRNERQKTVKKQPATKEGKWKAEKTTGLSTVRKAFSYYLPVVTIGKNQSGMDEKYPWKAGGNLPATPLIFSTARKNLSLKEKTASRFHSRRESNVDKAQQKTLLNTPSMYVRNVPSFRSFVVSTIRRLMEEQRFMSTASESSKFLSHELGIDILNEEMEDSFSEQTNLKQPEEKNIETGNEISSKHRGTTRSLQQQKSNEQKSTHRQNQLARERFALMGAMINARALYSNMRVKW